MIPQKINFSLVSIFGFFFLLLHLIVTYSSSPLFWGADCWRYLPAFFSYILFFAGIISLLPRVQQFIKPLFSKIKTKIEKLPILIWTVPAVFLLFFLRQNTFFLGDGLLRIRNAKAGYLFSAEEPLDTFIHSYLYKLLNPAIGISGKDIYQLISIFCGAVVLYFIIRFLKEYYEDAGKRWFLGGLILTTGTIQLFFGYVESYSIMACFVLLFLFSTLLMLKREKFSVLPALLLSLAVISHPAASFFVPCAFYGYYKVIHDSKNENRFIKRWTIACGIFCSIILLLLIGFAIGGFSPLKFIEKYTSGNNLLPLFSNDNTYGIFSLYHFLDIVNEILLTIPAFFALILLFFLKGNIFKSVSIRFLVYASLGSFFFMLVFNPRLGFSRDWDVFSVAALPITLFIGISILEKTTKEIFSLAFSIILVSFLHTAPWIFINSNREASVKRFENISETPYWTNFARGAANDELRSYYFYENNIEKSLKYAEEAYRFTKNSRQLNNLANRYYDVGEIDKSIEIYKELIKGDPSDVRFYINLANGYKTKGQLDDAIAEFKKAVKVNPDFHITYIRLGETYGDKGLFDEAIKEFNTAIKLNPYDPKSYFCLGIAYGSKGMIDKNIEKFNDALRINPEYAEVHFYLGAIYTNIKKNIKMALKHLELAKKYGYDPVLVENLLQSVKENRK